MNSLIEMLSGSWFAFGLVKSTIIAGACGAFILCIRQRDLGARLWAGLALMLPLAFFSGVFPFSLKALPPVKPVEPPILESTVVRVLVDEPAFAPSSDVLEDLTEPMHVSKEAGVPEATALRALPSDWPLSRDQWLLSLWIAGVAVTLVPGLLALLASRRLDRSAPPEEIVNLWNQVAGERAAMIPVRISSNVATPGIASVFRPEVILPEVALQWEKDQLLSVFRHELHHIRRGDLALRWMGSIACSLLWFHPLAWWVQSRLVIAQERAADEAVIAAGIPAPEYAGYLLAVASESRPFPGIAMARHSQVGRRIRMVLSGKAGISTRRARIERSFSFVMTAIGLLVMILGFSGPETLRAEQAAVIDDTGFRGPILDRNGVLLATSNPARMPEPMREKPPARWYPEGEAFAHAAGFVIPNRKREIAAGLENSPALADGKPLKLTVDARIQRLAAQALAARQLSGALMVMDPNTGDVLAMASWPAFDPNALAGGTASEEWKALSASKDNPLFNRATQAVNPGSFSKVLIALAAAKADKTDRVIHCGPSVQLGSASIRDWNFNRNEDLDLTAALATSCNTYFIPLAWELGSGAVAAIGKDFAFGPAGKSPWSWRATWPSHEEPEGKLTAADLAFTAIGQGRTQLSMIDMARGMSAIASGQIRQARFTESDPPADALALADLGIDVRELGAIRQGLIDSINGPRGVTKRARLEGTTVAGKSATAQVGEGGHAASFTGYVPAERPRFVVSALFFHEKDEWSKEPTFSGGATAAPVAAELMKALLEVGY